MKARIVKPQEIDSALEARWQAILDSDALYCSPFYSPHFARAVGEARDDAFVAVLEADGRIVGFFPFHRLRSGVAKPIGGPISDYHGPICTREATVSAEDLLRACRLKAYDFNHLPLAMSGLAKGAYASSRSPRVDLADGYEAFVRAQPPSWKSSRKYIDRRWRKVEREFGQARLRMEDDDEGIALNHWRMRGALYQKAGASSIIEVPWVRHVLDLLQEARGPDFGGVLTTLTAEGQVLAAHFGLRTRRVLHWWFPSYSLEHASLSPGILMIDRMTRVAPEHGFETIDFGRGDSPYKLMFANAVTDLCEGSIARGASAARLLRRAQRDILRLAGRLPLGRYESYPRRALARVISTVALPAG